MLLASAWVRTVRGVSARVDSSSATADGGSDRPLPSHGAASLRTTRLEDALDWAAGLAPSPLVFATACCGMSLAQGGDGFEVFGSAPPASSSRAADLLIVAGSISRRQAPLLREIHAKLLEPRWVVAWGVCAISGGAYDNYATLSGLSRLVPVDLAVPGCPPSPLALREAFEALRTGRVNASRRGHVVGGHFDGGGDSSELARWPILRESGRDASPDLE